MSTLFLKLPRPIYQDGCRYDYRGRYLVAGFVPGLYREEIAKAIADAVRGKTEPVKWSRTRLRDLADVIIEVTSHASPSYANMGFGVAAGPPKEPLPVVLRIPPPLIPELPRILAELPSIRL
jgi:hypothetical protein